MLLSQEEQREQFVVAYVHYENRKGKRIVSLKISTPSEKTCECLLRVVVKKIKAKDISIECSIENLDIFRLVDENLLLISYSVVSKKSIAQVVGQGIKKGHFVVRPRPMIGLVCQLRYAGERVASFVRYHLALGFDKIYLYFDDGSELEDAEIAKQEGKEKIYVRFRDLDLVNEWKLLRGYNKLAPFIENDVQVRQMLNALHAFDLARREDDLDWLLHLDSDELFYPGPGISSIRNHFAQMHAKSNCAVFTYYNFEAVPEYSSQLSVQQKEFERSEDPFRTVSLFKRPIPCINSTQSTSEKIQKALSFWHQRSPMGEFFLFYQNGKSAVRCSVDAVPASVHLWTPLLEHNAASKLCWTNDPRHKGVHYDSTVSCAILHFACTNAFALWQKYYTLGNFPNECVANTVVHEPNTFHCLCRDTLVSACASSTFDNENDNDQGRSAMYRLFLRHVALTDATVIEEHLSCWCS